MSDHSQGPLAQLSILDRVATVVSSVTGTYEEDEVVGEEEVLDEQEALVIPVHRSVLDRRRRARVRAPWTPHDACVHQVLLTSAVLQSQGSNSSFRTLIASTFAIFSLSD